MADVGGILISASVAVASGLCGVVVGHRIAHRHRLAEVSFEKRLDAYMDLQKHLGYVRRTYADQELTKERRQEIRTASDDVVPIVDLLGSPEFNALWDEFTTKVNALDKVEYEQTVRDEVLGLLAEYRPRLRNAARRDLGLREI